jgi:histidine triad (HIT) family protein
MPSVFSRIIAGELPGRFVWRDERCVAFLTIAPIRMGHVLVVPRQEVDHWIDLDPSLNAHLFRAAQGVARAVARVFPATKVGLMVAGLEVPHVHIHVLPIDTLRDMDFDRQALDAAAESIRSALRALGHPEASA